MPYGYICGWPTRNGDLYGGNMYVGSAADAAGLQALASAAAVALWGSGPAGSEGIAAAAGEGWAETYIAKRPTRARLLAIAALLYDRRTRP